jgi:hypothetical protein
LPEALKKTIGMVLMTAGLYLLSVALYSRVDADYDLWGYLSFGWAFLEGGSFPYRDVFSYTPTKPVWVYHEWLTGLSFYFIHQHAGMAGLQLLRYIIVLATIWLMYETALKRGATPVFAGIALVPAILLISFGYVPVRAQIFTYLFFMLYVYILEHARIAKRWSILAWLVPIEILWCNLHGGFVAGLGVIGLYALGEGLSGRPFLPLVAAGIGAALATLINPYGWLYWDYIFEALAMPRPQIDEWMSVPSALRQGKHSFPVAVFIAMSIVCLLALIRRRRKDYVDLLVAAAVIYVGLSHVRHGIFLGLIFGACLPVALREQWDGMKGIFVRRRPWLPGAAFAVLLLVVYLYINPFRALILVPDFRIAAPPSGYPVGAIHWIQQNNVTGNILPHFEWGELLIWLLHPPCRVAMDGRYETVYEDQVHREYFDFLAGGQNWKIFLEKYRHDIILIKADTQTHVLLQREPAWRKVYQDRVSVIFMRQPE